MLLLNVIYVAYLLALCNVTGDHVVMGGELQIWIWISITIFQVCMVEEDLRVEVGKYSRYQNIELFCF